MALKIAYCTYRLEGQVCIKFVVLVTFLFIQKSTKLKLKFWTEIPWSCHPINNLVLRVWCCQPFYRYHMRAIITRGLYTFYPLFEVQKRMVSIQEQFLIKSGL